MTMQTRDPTELLAAGKENSAAGGNQATTSATRAKLRRSSSRSSDAARRVYDSDRFKLVQSRRGSGAASPRPATASNQEDNVDMEPPPPPPAATQKKKQPTPQPVVPDQILEAYLDAAGFVKTRSYVKGKFLGKGGFARCYELKCEQTGKVYAGKVVAKSSLVKPKAKQKFTSEIKIHKSLHHPQVVQFEHFFEDSDNAYILLELCRNQSLSDLVRRRKRLSESEVRFYMRQLVDGLAYLHENLVIHRDLKLGNLFLTTDMRLKIGDFGLATRLDNPEDRKRTMCGTPNYIAPEILSGQRGDGHSFEVDIWSTGVVMYTLLVGRPPFETDDVKATYKRIRANHGDGEDGQHRLSESSSAAAIVAAAQRLKEIRAEAEEIQPLVPASLWISQWVDYTSKYGIGYMLSNGGSGVYFNDSTKMISSADGRVFEYVERQSSHKQGSESRAQYTMDSYDPALKKKVTLLGHFKGYLVDARAENDEADTLENQLARSFVLSSREVGTDSSVLGNTGDGASQSMVFVKKWVKTRHAVLFQLSNGTVQFNFFDKSKLMLSANARVVTYLDREGDLTVFSSSTAILTPERPDLTKRLRYAKDMLQQMVRTPDHK
ncbi:PLK/PLK-UNCLASSIFIED protein Kinase [Phytophthora cinnamomi]|uniref:PLK/PLK-UNCLASSIFIED protein Kinase n=1 Tax=Phytophthora cinnamomi TaxID=4785 RepID=UPI00355A70D0|nr:PLK/PLK-UNCLASSIFIED protein Kinase [Phytophthora cinnamomi]